MKISLGRITAIQQLTTRHHTGGVGKDAEWSEEHVGWRIFAGLTSFSLLTDDTQPPIKVGDPAFVIIGEDNATQGITPTNKAPT